MTAVSQPSGEVTLVFSDIEGSTRLLEELGTDAYREALAEHRRIVRESYGRYRGYEVDYEGDAFFYAFSSAADAVNAVAEAMAGLRDGPIAIRVGIHTGTPGLDPPKYVGMDVHFAARVMSSAHGGQVVCSAATVVRMEASGSEPRASSLLDLGEHRLKDIAEPVPLYQLGEGSFPPLKTISNTNLPRPASSFLGREHELQEVLFRIEEGARLLTLTGPGGTGKTRLALEVAASLVPSYKAGVFWLGLATLRDPALVTETIAQTLGAKDGLASHIAERELLLLLDNLEQVIACAPELASLLEACPNLTLLCTSRELLRVRGEVEYPVPPLAQPEAVSLFCERAQLEPSEEISELCARLDSLPLAVELAAARCKALTPAQILERLKGRLDLLQGGRDADPRQATLRATIEWSYDLLTPEEQELFARLSVFAGGCTLAAAEEVAGADLDTMQSLLEKSLLRFTPSEADSRYWMLETIREDASERLEEQGEAEALRQRHAEWVVALGRDTRPRLNSPDQEEVLRTLARELANMRSAASWLVATERVELLLDLLLECWWGIHRLGYLTGARAWFEHALAATEGERTDRRARVLLGAGTERYDAGDTGTAIEFEQESVAIRRRLGDDSGLAYALLNLGASLDEAGRSFEAQQALEEAIIVGRGAGDRGEKPAAMALNNLAIWAMGNDPARAMSLSMEAVARARALNQPDALSAALDTLVDAYLHCRQPDLAAAAARENLQLASQVAPLDVAVCIGTVACLVAAEGNAVAAAKLIGAVQAWFDASRVMADTVVNAHLDQASAETRRDLGEERYEALVTEGGQLTLDQAVEYALASID